MGEVDVTVAFEPKIYILQESKIFFKVVYRRHTNFA